jgi:deoxyadenosine/deoxycytidine kinase
MKELVIGLVGPCASGKTTMTKALRALGYQVCHIAQEHSYVPTMWQKIAHPDVLIYLDVSYETSISRRKLNWTDAEYAEQLRRLSHARQHADLIIQTDSLTPEEVLARIISQLD